MTKCYIRCSIGGTEIHKELPYIDDAIESASHLTHLISDVDDSWVIIYCNDEQAGWAVDLSDTWGLDLDDVTIITTESYIQG